MKYTHKRVGLGAALILVTGSLLAMAPMASASSSAQSPNACGAAARIHNVAGIVPAQGHCSTPVAGLVARDNARDSALAGVGIPASDAARGTPPLLFHGGSVMMTPSTGPLIVTPIFWNPAGYPMAASYKGLINTYLGNVATASGANNNVFSVLNEYYGNNGQINYRVKVAYAVNDTDPLPTSGCTVASTDTSGIYADGSGYTACLDDAQLQAEVDAVTSNRPLPHNLTHIYVLYLPKHVESCILPGSTTTSANNCTINYQPSATYCAYHSFSASSAVYANMPFPIYDSGTGFTCSSEINFGTVQSPNHNPDGDTEVSPSSHEISEAITDPDTQTGWYDSSGNEIGDECAYIFGPTSGQPGEFYNQVINGHRYLTQEEFSNRDFAITGGGCVQGASSEA